MKPKGVTIQMKALDEYFLVVVFMLLLNRVNVFANFMLTVKGLKNKTFIRMQTYWNWMSL